MSEYKVERVTVSKKYFNVIVEANSEKEAIDKARSLSTSDSVYLESTSQEEWVAKRHRESFWETLKNMFHSV